MRLQEWQRKAILEWWERRCQLRRDIDKMQAEFRAMGTLTKFAGRLGLSYRSVYNMIRYQARKVRDCGKPGYLRLSRGGDRG